MVKDGKITLVLVSYGKYPCEASNICIKSAFIKSKGNFAKAIVVHNSEESYWEKSEKIFGLEVKHIGRPPYDDNIFKHRVCATHEGLKYVDSEYIIISDPDVVYFKKGFDDFYIKEYKNLNLMFLGFQHFNPAPYLNFPCVINLFAAVEKLPPSDWMKGEFVYNGKILDGQWLSHNYIPKYRKYFPNPNLKNLCFWDIGCYLLVWAKQKGGNFLTICHNGDPFCYDIKKMIYNNAFSLSGPSEIFAKHARRLSTSFYDVKEDHKKEYLVRMREWMRDSLVGSIPHM